MCVIVLVITVLLLSIEGSQHCEINLVTVVLLCNCMTTSGLNIQTTPPQRV